MSTTPSAPKLDVMASRGAKCPAAHSSTSSAGHPSNRPASSRISTSDSITLLYRHADERARQAPRLVAPPRPEQLERLGLDEGVQYPPPPLEIGNPAFDLQAHLGRQLEQLAVFRADQLAHLALDPLRQCRARRRSRR